MLGKEDVLLWFKDLESYKRIDVMYELLNMCVPFEVRFLGSCIEEIGKHTYQDLRGVSIVANDADRLAKDLSMQTSLADESTRHRAVIYMSVLSARNCSCANWYYRTLFEASDPVEHVLKVLAAKDDGAAAAAAGAVGELLLLYTLGLHHPAFTFEQKMHFNKALLGLLAYCSAATNGLSAPPPPTPPSAPPPSEALVNLHLSSRILSSQNEVIQPVKTPSAGDALPIAVPPSGLLPLTTQGVLLAATRPLAAATTVVGPPGVPPFSTQSNTSLVSQASSPPQSRALSPHQLRPLQPINLGPPPPLPLPVIDAPMHLEPTVLVGHPLPNFTSPPPEVSIKPSDVDNHFISEEKHWPIEQQLKQNGMRYNKPYYTPSEHMVNLKIDDSKTMPPPPPPVATTNTTSNSSSASSRNASPTDTPTVTPHGPGRGILGSGGGVPIPPPPVPPSGADLVLMTKPRVNGMPTPSYITPQAQPPPPASCDPQPPTAPYSTVPSYANFPPPPHRYYPFRQPFPSYPFSPAGGEPMLYSPIYYSSVAPLTAARPLSCCNCGAQDHASIDCTAQSVEDITQTPYALDYVDAPTTTPTTTTLGGEHPHPPEK